MQKIQMPFSILKINRKQILSSKTYYFLPPCLFKFARVLAPTSWLYKEKNKTEKKRNYKVKSNK